jgi:predicted ribonuclease YlaK
VDTSALVYNPNIEEWSFEGIKCMTLAIPPTVISELDSYEMSNKNENVKEKARKLINKFKEYSRRGNLASGVTLVKNKINLFTLQQEPDMSKSLSHLNYQNNDDRIFASFIEVIRTNVNSTVILVSRDFNLHNKANHFSLPVFDPPTLK